MKKHGGNADVQKYQSVDDYFEGARIWADEQRRLREILCSTGLDEELKWGGPCYTYKGKNVVGLGAFKSYFGLWFHQGALLDDDADVLINAQEGKTRAMRQWRMHAARDIRAAVIRRYVQQAKSLIDEGKRIGPVRSKPTVVPVELTKALNRCKGATAKFRSLTPGKQREYADYVASAKRADTRARRIEKILPMIQAGTGLNDRYR